MLILILEMNFLNYLFINIFLEDSYILLLFYKLQYITLIYSQIINNKQYNIFDIYF